jgi:hypothetical protein
MAASVALHTPTCKSGGNGKFFVAQWTIKLDKIDRLLRLRWLICNKIRSLAFWTEDFFAGILVSYVPFKAARTAFESYHFYFL